MFKLLLIPILFPISAMGYVFPDTGDGSDGVCTSASLTPTTRTEYNCTSLYINSDVTLSPTSALTIKVQDSVVIAFKLKVSPGTGGGYIFGSEPFPNTAGKNATSATGTGTSGGSGGGGGSYNGNFPGQSGYTTDVNQAGDVHSIAGAAGSSFYGHEDRFQTALYGGTPGGSGGTSSSGAGTEAGGSGGSGGGVLRIISGDSITVDPGGIIEVTGEDGVAGSSLYGGGGGGGSGGTVFIQAYNEITIEGSITTQGGSGGTGAALNTLGDGGFGGTGRIRLDDYDGVIDGSQSGNTIPYGMRRSHLDKTTLYKELSTCGTIQTENDHLSSTLLSLLLGLLLSSLVLVRKFKRSH